MPESGEKIVTTTCSSHCGGQCILRLHVKDGVIIRIETDDGEEPQFRACLRGRAYRQRVYSPDRLKYPLKRVGTRGEGKFERISWDEALNTVAHELKRVKETYGPSAILYIAGGGDLATLHGGKPMHRALCMSGGCSGIWGVASDEGGTFAEVATYGVLRSLYFTRDNLLDSRLIIMWGWDPANTIQLTGTTCYLAQAREAGTRIVSVDPRYTDSTATFAHQWIPIRPGTDTAMLIALAYVMIKENLQDQVFLDTYTTGFDEFKDYVMGADGVAKTPAWAEAITGVPAITIQNLAREYAATKPAALVAGIAPGRTAYGEQYHRAAITLAAMAGNVGIRSGHTAARPNSVEDGYGAFQFEMGTNIRSGGNPVEVGVPPRKDTLLKYGPRRSSARVHNCKIMDAILKGKAGGYPADYKLLYTVNYNYLNQYPNVNKAIKALKMLEFLVVQEQFITATAKFADIILPVNTFMERNDIVTGGSTPFYGYAHKAIDPLYESKSHLEIAIELAARLGISDYNDKTEEEWLRWAVNGCSHIADYDTFSKNGTHKVQLTEPVIVFKKQIEDPKNNPFPTPSGKIEIYSQDLADMNNPKIPPVPKYIETWEGYNDPLVEKYPLQLVTTHFKRRALSQFDNVPWLRELQTQAVIINSADAQTRGISDGDEVRVFNDRGEMIIQAKVTERIMPGVVDIGHGAWYAPDEMGVDRGGCANILTKDEPSPGGAFTSNTCLVQVAKA